MARKPPENADTTQINQSEMTFLHAQNYTRVIKYGVKEQATEQRCVLSAGVPVLAWALPVCRIA